MILLYFALQSEAQIFIEKLRAKKVSSIPKIFISENILIVVGGVGAKRLREVLSFVFKEYKIDIAINIGIAGANSKEIEIGELFCIYPKGEIDLVTQDFPTTSTALKKPTLFDMEGEYFLKFCKEKVEKIFIFKVVSDHLDSKIPPKEFVKDLIKINFQNIIKELSVKKISIYPLPKRNSKKD
jgi:hypothetical protein